MKKYSYKNLLTTLLLVAVPLCAFAQSNTTVLTFAVSSGDFTRHDSPVSISLAAVALPTTATHYQLVEITDGKETITPFQLHQRQLYWLLSGETPAGNQRLFELRKIDNPSSSDELFVKAERDDEAITFRQNGNNLLRYQFAEEAAPEGTTPLYRRGGFIHPLWSPKGEVLTRIQPPDHYHHYGIWNPWTNTTFEGRNLDFWNLYKGQGTVKVVGRPMYHSGPVFGQLTTRHEHVDLTAPDPSGFKVALDEEWKVTVWNSGGTDAPRLIDFQTTLQCATDSIFTINAYRYQGFSFRATEKWDDKTAHLLTSQGKDKSNGNATRARWCNANGVSNFGTSGVLFMTHPQNHNFPEQLRIWPTGANGGKENVYFNFNPTQEQDWVLQPGQSYTLSYRMLVYDGKISPERMEQYWQDYAYPPKVEIVSNQIHLAEKRVLVYTKNGKGYVHDNIPNSIVALQKLGKKYEFQVETSDDPVVMTEENLQKYDALIFSNTNNELFDTDAQRLAFQRYIQAGGGFVGIHSACGSERQWPWFWNMLGGKFHRHPPLQDFEIEKMNATHPATLHLPTVWQWEDECYYLKQLNPSNQVLLTANLRTVEDDKRTEYPAEIFGQQFPLSWCRSTAQGRIWYTALGHKKEYYEDPNFLEHLAGGIIWVLSDATKLDYARATETLILEAE
ncbi:MAG: ThuA domain-containing protein [Bacteroidota bacterium]